MRDHNFRIIQDDIQGHLKPRVIPIPVADACPKEGIWTGNNCLGIRTTYNYAVQDRPQSIIKLPEWGFPEPWSVTLGVHYPASDVATPENFALVGYIETGVGGGMQEFQVDWKNGVTFSRVMNTLNLYVLAETIYPSLGPFNLPPRLQLSAMVARGTCVSNATRTLRGTLDTNGEYDIPSFATKVTIIGRTMTDAVLFGVGKYIEFWSKKGSVIGGSLIGRCDMEIIRNTAGYPIPEGARRIRFTGYAGVGFEAALQFALQL